jgi:16S rRNA C967 or C1407 C5-methylase (RsmB/RsmF family)
MICAFVEAGRNTKTVMEKNKKDLFLAKVRAIYPESFSELEKTLLTDSLVSFRIAAHANAAAVLGNLQSEDLAISAGPIENSFLVTGNESKLSLSKTKVFSENKIYIQGLSSMFDVIALNPKPADLILDLCAAPGSKTTLISQMTNAPENITAVESNTNRFFALKKNLISQGFGAAQAFRMNAAILPKLRPEFIDHFDKVLADVPCSNEGLFRGARLNDSHFSWNPKLSKKLPVLQKRLLAAGINMLKPGGTLIYSTCTYGLDENEKVVEWVLNRFPVMRIAPINIPLPSNFTGGLTEKTRDAIRILPTELFDAFFMCKFVKAA